MYQSCASCSWPSAGEWFLGHWGLNQSYLSLGQMSCGTELHKNYLLLSHLGKLRPLKYNLQSICLKLIKKPEKRSLFPYSSGPRRLVSMFFFFRFPLTVMEEKVSSHWYWNSQSAPISEIWLFAFSCFPQIVNPQEECLLYLMLFCTC